MEEESFDQLLKIEQVARRLQVSRSFAYLLMKRGDIPTVRMGSAVRVRPEDLEQYILERVSKNETTARSFQRQA